MPFLPLAHLMHYLGKNAQKTQAFQRITKKCVRFCPLAPTLQHIYMTPDGDHIIQDTLSKSCRDPCLYLVH